MNPLIVKDIETVENSVLIFGEIEIPQITVPTIKEGINDLGFCDLEIKILNNQINVTLFRIFTHPCLSNYQTKVVSVSAHTSNHSDLQGVVEALVKKIEYKFLTEFKKALIPFLEFVRKCVLKPDLANKIKELKNNFKKD